MEKKIEGYESVSWMELRAQFFNECVDSVNGERKINFAPHDLFEWFKGKISNSEFGLVSREEYYNLSKHNIAIIADLKAQREQLAEKDAEIIKSQMQADKLADALRDCIADLQYFTSKGHSVGLSSIESAQQTLTDYEKNK